MDTIFTRGPSLNNRLALALTMSVVLMFLDFRLDAFSSSRVFLNSLMSPIQYLANLPGQLLDVSAQRLTSRQALIAENEQLTNRLLLMSEKLQRFEVLERENAQLRRLLDAPVRQDMRKMVAELMAVDNTPYSQQIVINKGAIDGVFLGQAILDERGIVGQVMEVGTTNSRVLLISDVTHSIPVRSVRNNARFIASGGGVIDELFLEHVAHSTDVEVGDVLVSSGLGDVFPEGYPVAEVTEVVRDESRPFAQVTVLPLARLNRLKYLLILWPNGVENEEDSSAVEKASD
ncbi:MAG: rod shape-determining protein MreC [Pseudomonadota bacterium]|jgi:rod shape-determining protein MreC|uniref:Cell shape-determining protein MreC n=1 Tax=Marisediminitalea aggregata TaxID=634436 RepID=A0A1M5EF09_9ALTE|nr:rod shape-determining protein MreC [Marisediminitalea aggregata]MAP21100.1 rod shape-determining protein MreC [Alteromonadaceae bacterium]MCP3861687.1 rod shape-determining protein MreC [Aestuariibacter sp.]MEC7469518.1 rod shape-determining protein MreC [Pseudomonadota bacterium]MAX43316.1 rod shape-determining protein MreC [Alteromonadaceae bacterium]MBL54342.1 rod shape-determining protein MreC [Alteromonadaceae bacterium]|tara:strand:- start:274 stop:1140 length:867 start_codon:yes stop_codon:yes gene_type:complete